jgi:hypothetical protein
LHHQPPASPAARPPSPTRRALSLLARPEIAAPAILAPLLGLGLLLWAQWGWLIAFDALMTFCFG